MSAQTIATLRGMSAADVEGELRAAGIEAAEQPIAWAHPADLPGSTAANAFMILIHYRHARHAFGGETMGMHRAAD